MKNFADEVKDAMIIARGLMCEATLTKNTGLNWIISWVVDLNDRKSPFHSEYSCIYFFVI